MKFWETAWCMWINPPIRLYMWIKPSFCIILYESKLLFVYSRVVDFRVAFVFFALVALSVFCALVVVFRFGAYGCNLLRSLTWKTFFMEVNDILDRTFDEVQIIFSQWISKLEVKLDNFYQTWCIQILRTSVWKIQLK